MATKSTRDHLIDTGLKLMHQHGYNATGLTEILKAADVPKGSFYHHFGSKEDFAAATLERYTTREAQHAASVLIGSKMPLKRLKQYFMDLVKFYGQKGAIPGCLMGRFSLEIAAQNPQLRKQISTTFTHWQHTIATVTEQAAAQKELPAGKDPESLAGFLLNGWEGALLRSQAEESDAPLEVFMQIGFDQLLKKHSNA